MRAGGPRRGGEPSRRGIMGDSSLFVFDSNRLGCLGSPGLQGITRNAFEDILREVGRCLRRVHALNGDRYGYVGEHRPMEPQIDWASAFEVMWYTLLDDIERRGGY